MRPEFIDLEDGAMLIRQGQREFTLHRVHSAESCTGRACVVHNPTEHVMSEWPLIWRDDRGFFERLCKCGIGHPDPDQQAYWDAEGFVLMGVHGCCGCEYV